MINDFDENQIDELNEAKRAGYKFMKIYLDPHMIGRNQQQIIISGAVVLKAYKRGSDFYGGVDYDFQERRGDSMVFTYNRQEREYICHLYDDQGPGYFSEIGYNRDLLASHYNDNFFVIKDEILAADIEMRVEFLKKNPKAKRVSEKPKVKSSNNPQELKEQIKFLENKLSMISKAEEAKKKSVIKKNKIIKKLKEENVVPEVTDPKKVEVNA